MARVEPRNHDTLTPTGCILEYQSLWKEAPLLVQLVATFGIRAIYFAIYHLSANLEDLLL
jgi:hypothetical protein